MADYQEHSLLVQLHPLRQAVAHKAHIVEPAFFHSRALRHSRHTEIQRSFGAVLQRLHPQLPHQLFRVGSEGTTMADYQEYRRRILHRRWRRVFIIVALLALVALLSAIGILWKVLHRERVDTALSQNTILRQVTTGIRAVLLIV